MALETTLVLTFILGILIAAYIYGKWKYKYFENKNIKYIEPPVPFLGSLMSVMSGREHLIDFIKKCYGKFPNERYIGLFEVQKPLVMIRDVELINKICIKSFDTFHDHRPFIDKDNDLLGRTLFNLLGQKWRDMRATLSPAFTSHKMRNMFVYIEECARRLTNFYETEIEKNGGSIEIELKDSFARYSNDTIASSAFGLKIDSFEDPKNEFYRIGKTMGNFTEGKTLRMIALTVLPTSLVKFLKIQLFRPEVSSFFRNLVKGTMNDREDKKIVRHDMIHLLMEAKKGSLVHEMSKDDSEIGFSTVEESEIGKRTIKTEWTDDDYTAQGLVFFMGGFDTTASVLSFFFYEIVRNPDIQKKLHNEIDVLRKDPKNTLTYNDISKYKYLDMVVSETLRVWPPAPFLDRVCAKPFELPPASDTSDKPYTVSADEMIWIPVAGLHNDPQYFPKPEKFDPERFSDENKDSINPAAYLPFGIGPRNCIGSRYTLMVMKALIIHVLDKFEFVATEKTEIPVTLANVVFTLKAANGIWVGMKKRVK